MESTGKYWIPVFNILEKTCWVTLAHPKYTKPQKGNKTDRKDAKWICDLYMCGMVKPSFIPPPDIRQLRDLMRYRVKLTNMLTGEKNRAQNCLTVSNLKLDDVFSDVFGKSSRSIIQYILEHPGEQFDVTPFIHRRCKHPVEEIQAAVDGVVSREQAAKLKECLLHIDQLNAHRERIEAEILRLAEPYPYQLELIRTVPGFAAAPLTAVALISEIGVDMSVFPSAKHLASWAGCCPRNDQSNKKVKSTRISRAGCYLKPLLVQIANAVIKSDRHPECRERYRRIKARPAKGLSCRQADGAFRCYFQGGGPGSTSQAWGYIFKDELAVEVRLRPSSISFFSRSPCGCVFAPFFLLLRLSLCFKLSPPLPWLAAGRWCQRLVAGLGALPITRVARIFWISDLRFSIVRLSAGTFLKFQVLSFSRLHLRLLSCPYRSTARWRRPAPTPELLEQLMLSGNWGTPHPKSYARHHPESHGRVLPLLLLSVPPVQAPCRGSWGP